MPCLPSTGLASGTVSLLWLGLLLVVVGGLAVVVGRHRRGGSVVAVLLVGLAVTTLGVGSAPAHASTDDPACRAGTSAPGVDRPAQGVAPTSSSDGSPVGSTWATSPATTDAGPAPTASTTVASTTPPATTAPSTSTSTTTTTSPPLGACGPDHRTLTLEPTDGDRGYLIDGTQRWQLPRGWLFGYDAIVRGSAVIRYPIGPGVDGTLPVLLLTPQTVEASYHLTRTGAIVELDLQDLAAAIHADQRAWMAANQPANAVWVTDFTATLTLDRSPACPTPLTVTVPIDALIGPP